LSNNKIKTTNIKKEVTSKLKQTKRLITSIYSVIINFFYNDEKHVQRFELTYPRVNYTAIYMIVYILNTKY